MRWGLIPSWAKDKSIGYKMINARAETVAERPSYRTALQRRRCLVIADGFYEWQREGKARRPMRITLQSGEPFAFAGLWETWRDPEGERLQSCTIITTTPNDLVRPIHDRMPVILPPTSNPSGWTQTSRTPPSSQTSSPPTHPKNMQPTKSPPWSTPPPTTTQK